MVPRLRAGPLRSRRRRQDKHRECGAAVQVTDGVTTTQTSPYHTGNGAYQTLSTTITVGPTATILYVRVICAAAATVYVDNAMLVVGSQPADYVPLHPADDLARCLRYYEKILYSPNEYATVAHAYANNSVAGAYPYMTTKPVAPTLTVGGGFACTSSSFTVIPLTTFTPLASAANRSLQFSAGIAGTTLVAGNASTVLGGASGGSIAVEANP